MYSLLLSFLPLLIIQKMRQKGDNFHVSFLFNGIIREREKKGRHNMLAEKRKELSLYELYQSLLWLRHEKTCAYHQILNREHLPRRFQVGEYVLEFYLYLSEDETEANITTLVYQMENEEWLFRTKNRIGILKEESNNLQKRNEKELINLQRKIAYMYPESSVHMNQLETTLQQIVATYKKEKAF